MKYTEKELVMKLLYYKSLPEKSRRHFLALEYEHLGKGSQRYISKVFKCSRNTITKGTRELSLNGEAIIDYSFQRKAGGGRKKRIVDKGTS